MLVCAKKNSDDALQNTMKLEHLLADIHPMGSEATNSAQWHVGISDNTLDARSKGLTRERGKLDALISLYLSSKGVELDNDHGKGFDVLEFTDAAMEIDGDRNVYNVGDNGTLDDDWDQVG